jgi:hypothetical protein
MLSQVKGNTLPFYAYATPDGKFISGTSGFRSEKVFKADLEGVLKNDALKAPPELEKKLAKMAEQAAKDFEAKKFAAVLKAAKDADAIRGFSESKDKIKDLQAQTLEAGNQKIKEAAQLAGEGKFDDAARSCRRPRRTTKAPTWRRRPRRARRPWTAEVRRQGDRSQGRQALLRAHRQGVQGRRSVRRACPGEAEGVGSQLSKLPPLLRRTINGIPYTEAREARCVRSASP